MLMLATRHKKCSLRASNPSIDFFPFRVSFHFLFIRLSPKKSVEPRTRKTKKKPPSRTGKSRSRESRMKFMEISCLIVMLFTYLLCMLPHDWCLHFSNINIRNSLSLSNAQKNWRICHRMFKAPVQWAKKKKSSIDVDDDNRSGPSTIRHFRMY